MASTSNPQYQHFVPQFLLRNFSHPYKPDGGSGTTTQQKKRKSKGRNNTQKYEKGKFPGDPVIRHLDLTATPPCIDEKPVKRILGQMNMYDDPDKPTEQQQKVERLLSQLEGQASGIFRKITKAHENKEAGLRLPRNELCVVRKFLFLLKYRNQRFYQRFSHDSPEGYIADDRELVREYMTQKGFTRPLEVWLEAIEAIITTPIDLECKWKKELPRLMYTMDATWFIKDFENYYMSLCTPEKEKDEFILVDNSYGVFEGRNSFVRDGKTGKVEGASYTPLHMFAPISPRLIIVLRAVQLPDQLEDKDEMTRRFKEFQKELILGPKEFNSEDPEWGGSLLAGLPIAKARNNYSKVVDGRLVMTESEWKPSKHHVFDFVFFRIERRHVNVINGIFLDNCGYCTSVVFESVSAFQKTMEWFLTAPCEIAGKTLAGTDAQVREVALNKMIDVARGWGFQGTPVIRRMEEPLMEEYETFRQMILNRSRRVGAWMRGEKDAATRELEEMFRDDEDRFSPKSEFYQLYSSLGGSYDTIPEDLDQAQRMWNLRVKIDSWSSGKVAEHIRQRNRELLLEAYLRLPPRRIWIYSNLQKLTIICLTLNLKPDAVRDMKVIFEGPETTIIRAKQIVKPGKLSELIHRTGLNDATLRKKPGVNLWKEFDNTSAGNETTAWVMKLVFEDESASIRYCGIPEIEEAYESFKDCLWEARTELRRYSPWFAKIMTELMVRMGIKKVFTSGVLGLEDKVEDSLLDELKSVLFEVTYPTPPDDFRWK
ncbi:hypothetical protein QBC38DRAFT_488726 [Podospora fimiseda]|uniref:DUF4238 domain-containing protein n=1 Tax=Podospora fimiseda TaxID=252190 RepID=A0AAN7BGD5_9PEZI|nr:hypothetical protein QBC38DRAFT_488726 [Podospora fimiseda]